MDEKRDLTVRFEESRENGSLSRHLIRNFNDMIYHSE